MSFAVRLSSDLISVEAGATMPLSVEVVNRNEEADRFELEIEGLDPEWTAIPVPTFVVGPGETSTEKIFFRTPRTPESQSGNYPFVAKIRSLNSGEQRTAQGVLQVQPYHHISAEISPKKGVVASFKRRNHFTLTIINMGNVEHTLQLFGADPDEALAFDFEQDQVTLGPGQQKEIGVTVQPTSRKMLWNVELHGFSITARSVEPTSVAAVAQAQLEAQPAVKASTLILAILLAGVAFAWWWARPQPPTFSMGLSQNTITKGDSVKVFWEMANADRVHITAGNKTLYDSNEAKGSFEFKPDAGGTIDIEGYAIGRDKQSPEQHLRLNVNVPPPAPAPEITQFSASPTKVKVGDSTILTYKFNNAVVSAALFPQNQPLNINANQIEVPITDEGSKTLTIVATNKDNVPVKKSLTITGYRATDVNIIAFTVTPKDLTYPGGLVNVSWQLTNAIHAEISPNAHLDTNEVDPNKGSFEMYIDKSTTFTLTAKDKNNLGTTQTARVVVEPQTLPSTSSTGGLGPDNTTTASTTGGPP